MHVSFPSFKNIVFAVKPSRLRFLFVLLLALIAFSFSTYAQQATIVGTVTDPSGAVVPNVAVTITNTDTGLSRVYPSNDAGQFVAPDLQIGHYTVKAEAKGFKASEQKNIVLNVGDRIRVDFQMQLGAAQETVTVEANTVQVQTDSGERSNLITDQQLSQIAVNGRSIYQLAALTPGAVSQITGFVNTPVGGNASVEFNGMRQNHNIYLLDGGEDDDRGGAGGMSIAPSTDAIAEFRALTSNYSADYGLSSAGTMTMVLKSGSSTLHASAWEFNRNDYFDARNYFVKKQELRLNVFGFNVGGPVTFGHLYNPDKKKTFFFYNMEWRRLIQGGATNQAVPGPSVYPTAAGADLSSLGTPINVPTFCGPGTVIGPCTGSNAQVAASVLFANCPGQTAPAGITSGGQFPGAMVPACMINPNAAALLNAHIFPAANGTDVTGKIPQFQGGANSATPLKEEIVRIDHNFSDRFSVFGHFIAEQVSQGFAISQWSGDNVPTVGDTFGNPSRSGVIHTTYMIRPTLINEVAFNYNGNVINIVPYAASGLASLALPTGYDGTNSRLFTGPNNLNRIPNIDISGGSINPNFEISSWPWHNKADDYQIRDDVSWTKGAHQIKMGGSWALYKKVQDLFGQTQGGYSFNGTYTGIGYADMLLGLGNYQELAVQDKGLWNNVSWAAYVQDNWRVNRRLTLNLGLRWDGVPHTYEANNRMGNFYPSLYKAADAAVFDSSGNICNAADTLCSAASPGLGTSPNPILAGIPLYLNGIGIPGQNGVPKGLVNNHWAAFGPRLGFAYDLTGSAKTVVRGGFGIMYERIQGNDMYNAGPNIPFSLQVNVNAVNLSNASQSLATGNITPASALPTHAASITGLDIANYKLPVSYQWSIGVQHALSSRSVFTVSYVGNVGRHQNFYTNINLPTESDLGTLLAAGAQYQTAPGLPYLGFTSIKPSENEANTHYNGLQMDLNAQLSHDLTLRALYTYSKAVDPTTAGSGGGDLGTVSNPYAGWLYDVGPSGYDIRHVAVVDFIYDIPLFRHSESRLLKTGLGGWQISGIVTMESGLPLNIGLGNNQGGNFVGGSNRPDLVSTVAYPHTVGEWFNPGSQTSPQFAFPAPGAWGTLGHNALRGPGRDNWNVSLFKDFVISEARGSRFELRLETFNTWNHTQFQNIGTTFNGYNTDGSIKGNFGQVTSAYDPRILQLGGKIYF
ncbi:MAG: carboxypeptidase regulatory-like domain-containing protein [Candidatus Acidiferrum sp.]